MGYRSTIIFGVKQSHAPKLDEILKEHGMIPDKKKPVVYPNYKVKNKHGNFEKWERVDDSEMIIYKFEYVKWYEDYDDVRAVTKYLKGLAFKLDEDENVVEADDYETTFLVGLGEMGETHSEIGDWYNYVDHISKLEISE